MITLQEMVVEIDGICEESSRREICIEQDNIGHTVSSYDNCSYENNKLIFSNDYLLDQIAIFDKSEIKSIEYANKDGVINYIICFYNGFSAFINIFLA